MSTRDLVVVLVAIVSCALWMTAHISILAALAVRPPRWRAAVAVVFPPAAPFWAYREKLLGRAGLWLCAAVVYAAARIFAG